MRCYQAISNRYALLTFLLFLVPAFWHFECLAAELRLTWVNNSTDEEGFGIDRKTGLTGTYTTIASLGPAIMTYTDAGLLDDTEYCYRIYSFNSATTSSYSDEACGITLPALVANIISTNISQEAVLSGNSVLWSATPSGVPARVEFLIDDVVYWTEFRSVYQFNGGPFGTLDTTTLSNGSHELRVRAVYNDNSTAELTTTVTVSNSSAQQFFVTLAKAGTGSGMVTSSPVGIDCGTSCSAIFNSDTTVTLTPTAAAGSIFAGWNDSSCGSSNIATDMNCSATFNVIPPVTYTLTVTKAGTGNGTVTSSPTSINCGSSCSVNFNSGTVIALTAIPAAGSVFAGWSGAGCTTGALTLTTNAICTATFTPLANTISTNISNRAVLSGASVLWTATPSGVPARVEFSIDGVLHWTELRSVYQFHGDPLGTLDTTTLSDGSHELRVRAVYADNSIAEKMITVTVLNRSTQPLAARIGIFRPSTGEWFLDLDGNRAFDGCAIDICVTNFGASGMRPVVGDWYGTGKTNIGIYVPQTGTWHLDDGNGIWDDCESGVDLCIASFGAPGSYPVTKESSDADQIVIGFFQPKVTEIVNDAIVTKLGQWTFDINGNGILDSCTIDQCIENFGQSGDLPVVGNWDGAGEKIGIFRPQSGEWLLDLNGNGMWDGSPVDRLFGPFGRLGDRPVVGDWDGTGVIRIGVFRPSTGQWFQDVNGNGQLDDCSVDTCIGSFGQTGDRPVVGNW